MRLIALGALIALFAATPAFAGKKQTPTTTVSPAASVYVEQVPTKQVSNRGESKAAGSTSSGSGGAPVGLIAGVGVVVLASLGGAVALRTRSLRRRHA